MGNIKDDDGKVKERNGFEAKRPPGKFVMVPYDIAWNGDLPDGEMRMWVVVKGHCVGDNLCTASYETLAAECRGISRGAAIRRIKSLMKKGFIRREIRIMEVGDNDTNVLTPLIDGEPVPASYASYSSYTGYETGGVSEMEPPSIRNGTPGGVDSVTPGGIRNGTQNHISENHISENHIEHTHYRYFPTKNNESLSNDSDSESLDNEALDLQPQAEWIEQNLSKFVKLLDELLNGYEDPFTKWYQNHANYKHLHVELGACLDHLINDPQLKASNRDLSAYFRKWLRRNVEIKWEDYCKDKRG